MPSSSDGPELTCSGVPSGKRWRQMWNPLPVLAEKYIHLPSGDQAALVHCAGWGPTFLPAELPSKGAKRHGCQPLKPISASRRFFRSGDKCEKWSMTPSDLNTVRSSERLSVEEATANIVAACVRRNERHLLSLFRDGPGGIRWRRRIGEPSSRRGADAMAES